jgi:hypothetical protein
MVPPHDHSEGEKMVTVRVRQVKSDPGFRGSTPQGTVTVSFVVQSDELDRLEIGVQVLDQANEKLNVQEAHAVLQRFSKEFSEALMQPLAMD